MAKRKYRVDCEWLSRGSIEVEAISPQQAKRIVENSQELPALSSIEDFQAVGAALLPTIGSKRFNGKCSRPDSCQQCTNYCNFTSSPSQSGQSSYQNPQIDDVGSR